MPVQFQGVTVHTLPGAREGRPDGLHPFLEPAAAALEDPEPYVSPGLAEKREMDAEPVVFPRRGTALSEELLQPLLAVGGQPVYLQRPAAGPRPCGSGRTGRNLRLGLVVFLRDQPGGEKFVKARIQRPVGQSAERAQHGVELLAQLVAVHWRPVQQPEHGQLEYAGAVASHASPRRSWYSGICRSDASLRYFGLLDRRDVSNRYMWILCGRSPGRKYAPFLLVRPDFAVNTSKSGLGSRAVPRRAHRGPLPDLPESQAHPRDVRLRRRTGPVRGTGQASTRARGNGGRIR